ncbi:hypothetical protein PPL_01717 [Heterostelium album PN500]|uniref:Ankyrin repeat protein n=1 Tax=Heterostelium pallidum (strain ATCC 26659 / Pp 5 / PN500) TaxID=670386 RepID=D3B0A1_HETP5|nr:hypothetical protein PPL_01717 [Heterostelium album PN500]EFA84725.1 hypothetical protein PPL_01717 [Heterostelium album PN500]|eukprot:XP_020436837.1 hypothetical protein PPL_01717 [Heterostelium album PN500]
MGINQIWSISLLITAGSLDILKYFVEDLKIKRELLCFPVDDCDSDDDVREDLLQVANFGKMDIIQYLESLDDFKDQFNYANAMLQSVFSGDIELLKITETEGCSTSCKDNAASGNHLKVVKWLHENRTEGYSPAAFDLAVIHGHTKLLNG